MKIAIYTEDSDGVHPNSEIDDIYQIRVYGKDNSSDIIIGRNVYDDIVIRSDFGRLVIKPVATNDIIISFDK